jgi:hypothetical protein
MEQSLSGFLNKLLNFNDMQEQQIRIIWLGAIFCAILAVLTKVVLMPSSSPPKTEKAEIPISQILGA